MGFLDRGAAIAVTPSVTDVGGQNSVVPIEVYRVGGVLNSSNTFADGLRHQLLPAPPTGFAYALKRIAWTSTPAGANSILVGGLLYSSVNGPGVDDLDGLLALEALNAQCPTATGAYVVSLFYDTVLTPTLL